MPDDGRRDEARAIPIADVAAMLGAGLTREVMPGEFVGPCPVCGGADKRDADRFSYNTRRGLWHCRKCAAGGDGLALVQHVRGGDFRAALDFLLGAAEAGGDPAEVERRRRAAAEAEAARQAEAEQYRARAIRDAREIWHAAEGRPVDLARAYLAVRGIVFPSWPPTLRCLPDHVYSRRAGGVAIRHRGPAMIAAIQNAAGRVVAVHQTWIDPARPGRKARIAAEDGTVQPAKLVRGSKKGGAIRLTPAPAPGGVLVMGEGIETTASALVAGALPGAAFWAGVDLGNMGGRQVKVAGQRNSGLPDMADPDAWGPPAGLGRLVFLQDGDSDPAATRARLLAGLRRAQARQPGLVAQIVAAAPGRDFNDMINPKGEE